MDGKTIIELKQERATLTMDIRNQMKEFEGKAMDAIAKEALSKKEARFDEINASIIAEERQLERERVAGEKPVEQPSARMDSRSLEIMAAFKEHIATGSIKSLEVYNALQQDNPTQAGYLVAPEKFVSELIAELNNTMFMRQKGKVLPTLKGAHSLGYPKRTARMTRAAWGTELATPTTDTALAFGKKEFKPNPASAEILVSKNLIRNAPGVEGIVMSEMAYMFAELMEIAYMTGDGANKPLGLFTASADGISTARDVSTGNTATEIKIDGLLEAKYSVKDQYQSGCEWIFHRDAIKQIAKLKDSDGQYIWQPSISMNTPDMLLGRGINSSEYAPNTFTSGLYVGMYGDLRNYWICDSLTMEMQVLMELYARTNQVDYMARIETDGMPVLEEAFARIKLG